MEVAWDVLGVSGPSSPAPPHQRQFGGPLGRIVSEQYPFNLTEYLKTYDVKNNVTYKGEGWISIPESGEYTFCGFQKYRTAFPLIPGQLFR